MESSDGVDVSPVEKSRYELCVFSNKSVSDGSLGRGTVQCQCRVK